jgi:uncharacterized membrane protein
VRWASTSLGFVGVFRLNATVRSILLGLELLVAADIIRTVAVDSPWTTSASLD